MDFVTVATSSTLYDKVVGLRELIASEGLSSAAGGKFTDRRRKLCSLRPDIKSAVANAVIASWSQPNADEYFEYSATNILYIGKNTTAIHFIEVFGVDNSVPVRGVTRVRIKRNGEIQVGGEIIGDDEVADAMRALARVIAKSPKGRQHVATIAPKLQSAKHELRAFWGYILEAVYESDEDTPNPTAAINHKELSNMLLQWQSPNATTTALPSRFRNWSEWGAAVKKVNELIKTAHDCARFLVWYAVKSKYDSAFWPDGSVRKNEIPSPNSIREVYSTKNLWGQYLQYDDNNPDWDAPYNEAISEIVTGGMTYQQAIQSIMDSAQTQKAVIGVDLRSI